VVRRALDSRVPVLGTLQERHNDFLDAIRGRADVAVVRVTTSNRECMVPVLRDRVMELLSR